MAAPMRSAGESLRRNCLSSLALRLFAVVTLLAGLVLPALAKDDRDNFESDFYFGLGIDSFAAAAVNQYLNPQESGQKKERGIGGFDFDYRLWNGGKRQIWIYGETVHGVRSADLNLNSQDSLANFELTGYANPGNRTLYMIRNATSLEALAGVRLELFRLNDKSSSTTAVYLMGEYGLLTVAGLGQDVVDESRAGIGMVCITGDMKDSHLEVGTGRTDLFAAHRFTRFKVDGLLNWSNDAMRAKGMSMFSQITVDADLGPGSDSVQSFLGFNFQLEQFLK